MHFIRESISRYSNIPEISLDKLEELLELQKFKKGEKLINANEVPSKFYILKSGIVRAYTTNENGKDFVHNIYIPIISIASFSALLLNKPSKMSFECLIDSEIFVGDFKSFKKLAKTDIHISKLYSKITEALYIRMENRIYELSVLSATERYLKLKQKMPKIESLIPQYHIASFLNITPVQLSRIRKEIFSK
jgi:CRP-like cAMP-binding protein